jgi:light-regulated signal transduction histidine kinase (bacteriophytochrome)
VTTKAQPFKPTNLNTIASEVLSDLETRIDETGGEVVLGDLPTIDADELQMRQLFQNLIANALKFRRPDAAPRVEVTSQDSTGDDRENGFVRISVKDNGIGFEEKYLDRIFTPFQRLHGRNEYEGTGIGLAVCRKIVERHGGSLTATSSVGEGSTFIATLPLKQNKENR